MRCRHRTWSGYVWRIGGCDVPCWFTSASFETPDGKKCLRCNEWLPLGPANDAPAEVAIEVRAAEIAVSVDYGCFLRHVSCIDDCAGCGWRDRRADYTPMFTTGDYAAGYLARCIHDHDTEGA
jgi:hypothetical protein